MQLLLVAVLSLLIVAQAYMPSRVGSSRAATTLAAEKSKAIPYMDAPVNLKGMIGDKGFDPAGFSNFLPASYLREAELKHGRVAMLGVVGYIATDLGLHLPGSVHEVGSLAAHNAAVSSGSMFQIFALVAAIEFISIVAIKSMIVDGSDRIPGDYGLPYFGCKTDAEKNTMRLKELENGRLAMVAFSGIVTQAALYNLGFPYF